MKRIAISLLTLAFSATGVSTWSNAADKPVKLIHLTENIETHLVIAKLTEHDLNKEAAASLISSKGETRTSEGQKAILLAIDDAGGKNLIAGKPFPAIILTNGDVHFGIRGGTHFPEIPVVARVDNKGAALAVEFPADHPVLRIATKLEEEIAHGELSGASIEEFYSRLEDAWQKKGVEVIFR